MSYTIGMYLRLSDDDEQSSDRYESNSISNQRELIMNFISRSADLCECEIKEFCDDGVSGVTFNRPSVQKLFDEIRKGKINCVIVKDLSRFGRNHIEVGDYLEQIFPVLNVRFIALNDSYDSNNNVGVAGTEVAFKNLMNENYSRDLSEKIKSVVRVNQAKGYFVGSNAPYGYKNVKKKLVIDESAAKVVRRIFEMADKGMKYARIAHILNEEGVYTKKEHYYNCRFGYLWQAGEISKILHNKVYIGTLISRKTSNYAPKKYKKNDESEYLIFEDNHDAIISKELFESVSRRFYKSDKPKGKILRDKEFHRKVICGGCKKTLHRNYQKNGRVVFYCRHKLYDVCKEQKLDMSLLKETILKALEMYINLTAEKIDKLKEKVKSNQEIIDDKVNLLDAEITRLEQRKLILYTEYKDNVLTKSEYLAKRETVSDKLEKLSKERETILSGVSLSDNFIEAENIIAEYKSNTMTNEMLIEKYLKQVVVYSADRIEIEWNFEDVFTLE